MEPDQEIFMQRCLQLAGLGRGQVSPNPLVGALLVHEGRIIGEGYHRKFGEPHAEVNCLDSVEPADLERIEKSILYVNLEPCAHTGKTPPCAVRIIHSRIPEVVIGSEDPNILVQGRGIKMLQDAGIRVEKGILAGQCQHLNRRFFTFHEAHRPYIILKWAQSINGCIAAKDRSPVKISNPRTDRLAHRWRSEEAAVMVGGGTVLTDNPGLTNRYWTGNQPLRIIWDPGLHLSGDSRVLDGESPALVFNLEKDMSKGRVEYIRLSRKQGFIGEMMTILHYRQVSSVLVEGGAVLLGLFIGQGYWDEARIITGNVFIEEGIPAPVLAQARLDRQYELEEDRLDIFRKRMDGVN